MSEKQKENIPKPEIGPYVFPTLLALFGLWCFYDGWLSANPEMQEHLLLNRIGSVILLPWALIDFIRTRRKNMPEKVSSTEPDSTS